MGARVTTLDDLSEPDWQSEGTPPRLIRGRLGLSYESSSRASRGGDSPSAGSEEIRVRHSVSESGIGLRVGRRRLRWA